MGWDLWESSYQDTLEDCDYMQYGWNCDFFDVIEENALNEKSCIQVLRMLIAKEDMEIDELEHNLGSLQTELACTELEEWPELCCSVLREKIDGIDATLRSLKNKSGDVSELQLLMRREPAEKIDDILKAILRKHLLEKDKQPPEVINVDMKSDASENATVHFKSLEQRQLESDVTVKVEHGETVSSEDTCSKEISSPGHQESKTNHPNIIKPAATDALDLSPVCLRQIVGPSDEEKKLVMTDSSEAMKQCEVIEREPISKDEKVIQSKPLTHREDANLKPTEYGMRISSAGSFNFSKECVSVVKSLCRSDRKSNQSIGENMSSTKQDSTSPKDSHPRGSQENGGIDESRNAIVEYVSLDDFVQTAIVNARNPISKTELRTPRPTEDGDHDLEKKLVELKRKTTKKDGIREPKIGNATVKSQHACETQAEPQKSTTVAFYKSDLAFAPKLQNLVARRTFQSETQSTVKPKVDESNRAGFKNQHFNCNNLKPQSPTENRKSQPDSPGVIIQQAAPPTKRKHNITSSHPTNKRPKSDTNNEDNACLNQVLVKSSESVAKEHNTSLAIVELLPGSKKIPNFPHTESSVDLKLPEPGSNGDSKALSLTQLPSDDSDLGAMKVDGLRTLAKEMKLIGYSKLRKSELIEKIKSKREESKL